jgi:hypothetical protein
LPSNEVVNEADALLRLVFFRLISRGRILYSKYASVIVRQRIEGLVISFIKEKPVLGVGGNYVISFCNKEFKETTFSEPH